MSREEFKSCSDLLTRAARKTRGIDSAMLATTIPKVGIVLKLGCVADVPILMKIPHVPFDTTIKGT
jgi:hypothetical protein